MSDVPGIEAPFCILTEDGRLTSEADLQLAPDLLQRLHWEMLRLRRLDDRLMGLQRQGRIASHNSTAGQEAVPVALGVAARSQDWVFPAFREGGVMLVRGFPLHLFLAQVFGTSEDVQRGRQMPGHQSAREVNQVAWSSCVGTQLTHAVGAALAARYRGDDTVMIACFGDGAASSPDFHAALNLASVLDASCIFLCQNNQYALSTPASRQTAALSIAIKGRAYAVPAQRVDGNDVIAVHQVLSRAISNARRGGGPCLIEAVTYRIGPHSTSDDPTRYRPEAEVNEWSTKDPLARIETYLRGRGLLDDASLSRLEAELMTAIREALEAVQAQMPPARASLFDDVYARPPWHLVEQCDELSRQPAPSARLGCEDGLTSLQKERHG